MQQEIFGPILSLVTCDTFNQAVDFINERDTPLAAYCFTKGKLQLIPFIWDQLNENFWKIQNGKNNFPFQSTVVQRSLPSGNGHFELDR